MTSFIIFSDVVLQCYWLRIKLKVAEITVCQTLLFSGENCVGAVHLINVSYSVGQAISQVIKQNKHNRYGQLYV